MRKFLDLCSLTEDEWKKNTNNYTSTKKEPYADKNVFN